MGGAASVAALTQKQEVLAQQPDQKSKKDSIVVEIVRANHLSECFGPQRKQTNLGCHSYVKFWLTSGEDLDTVKGIKAKTLARVNAFDPVFRSYRCLYSSADPNDVLHLEVWDNTVSSRPLAQVRVTMAETTSGFVLIKKLNLLHPNPVKSNDDTVDDAVNMYRVDNANQVTKTYKTSPAADATISFRVLFPHKTKGWRRRRTLFVIRHGESKWNAALANKNLPALMHFDHPLSMRGIAQAKKLEDTWTADLKKQNISLTLPTTMRQLKNLNESDFDPIADDKTERRNSLEETVEETDSGDESEEESDDDKPVREQMNETVGGNGRSIDASNPNAVLEGLEGHAVSANASGQRDVKSKNTTKTNTSASTSKETNANKPPRASSVSATTQPSTASVPANSTTAHGSEGGNRPNIALDTDDKSVAEHGNGIPLTPVSFRKHIETKISARDTPPNGQSISKQKARVVIRNDPKTAEHTTNETNPTDIQDNKETDDKAALQQRVASSIGLSLGPDKAPTSGRQSAFQFPSMELVNGDQTDTRELEVIRSNSFGTSRVLTPRTGHSHQSPIPRQTFDFKEITVAEDIKTQRKLLSKPKAEPPTHSFKDSSLRFYGASAVFSSPLTRATQTALLSLASHPVLCNSGMTLLASLREKKTQGGLDSVGKEVDKGIYMRTEKELAATLLAAKDRTNGAKANAAYININANVHSHSNMANMDLPTPDPAEQARRAMRKMDPYDCVTQWWVSVQHKDSKQSLLSRISDFLCTMEFHPTEGAIVVVGHSLFIRTFLRTYMAEPFAQEAPELAEDMSQKKLQNAGCIRVDLDFQTPSHGGTMAIVNAELMFGSEFGENKITTPAVPVAPLKIAGSAKGPPSANLAELAAADRPQRTRRLSPPAKFMSRELLLSKNIDDFKLPGPMVGALQTAPELRSTR